MKKHVSAKILVPLLAIFVLTLTVNITVTRKLQSVRQTLQTLAGQEVSAEGAQVQQAVKETAEGISSALAKIGVISSMQLFMVIVTIVIAFICIRNPIKKIIQQLEQLTDNLENDKGNLEERIVTNKTDEIGQMVDGINLYMDKLQFIMKHIQTCSASLDGSSNNISSKVISSKNEVEVVRGQAEELFGQQVEE